MRKNKIYLTILVALLFLPIIQCEANTYNLPLINFPTGPSPDSAFFFNIWNFIKSEYFYTQPIIEDSASVIWQEVKEAIKNNPKKNDSIIFAGLTRLSQTTPDGYTYFFNPEETKEWKKHLSGKIDFSGIGIYIVKHEEKIKIFKIVPNSPAEKAGLQRGDIIKKVNNQPINSFEEVTNLIRGEINTAVELTIQRADSTLEIKVFRERIDPPRIEWRIIEIIDQEIYYLKLQDFNQGSANIFYQALDSLGIKQNWISNQPLDNSKKKTFILDLRGNLGGLVNEVQKILGFWTNQIIFYYVFEKSDTIGYKSSYPQPLANLKTIILTDRNTASASEIATGALLSYGLATTVGDTTYGKGCGQSCYECLFETALKVTTFIWLTPEKKCIDKVGFPPKFLVEFDYDLWFEKGIDNQLEAAIKIAKIK